MPPARRSRTSLLVAFALFASAAACSPGDRAPAADSASLPAAASNGSLDELPRILNAELPFRYPPDLYARKAQADVLLRLYIDSTGAVAAESTAVVQSSGEQRLDSAAVAGAAELAFAPGRRRGAAVGTSVLLPVQFRHPDAPPLAGDSASGAISAATDTRP